MIFASAWYYQKWIFQSQYLKFSGRQKWPAPAESNQMESYDDEYIYIYVKIIDKFYVIINDIIRWDELLWKVILSKIKGTTDKVGEIRVDRERILDQRKNIR